MTNTFKIFWSRVNITDSCWEWTGGTNTSGYGTFNLNRIKHLVHRLAYELIIGLIPKGLVIHHICRNKKCVNPNHL